MRISINSMTYLSVLVLWAYQVANFVECSSDQAEILNNISHELGPGITTSNSNKEYAVDHKILIESNSQLKRKIRELCIVSSDTSSYAHSSAICSPISKNSTELQEVGGIQNKLGLNIQVTGNRTCQEVGSSFTLSCRVDQNIPVRSRYTLRWLRSSEFPQGEESIQEALESDPSLIITATIFSKVSLTKYDEGLDLEVRDFQSADAGTYICQAVSDDQNKKILDEIRIQLSALEPTLILYNQELGLQSSNSGNQPRKFNQLMSHVSEENLLKLMPSLKVVPSFAELAIGETTQLVCSTSDPLTPDPDPKDLIWTFEPTTMERNNLLHRSPIQSETLPSNVTIVGNVLIIWRFTQSHIGLYRCSVEINEFNITAQSSAELTLRPEVDSAPLVYVSPELIRIPLNKSAKIQCEASGYPPPQVTWYRVDSLNFNPNTNRTSALEHIHGQDSDLIGDEVNGLSSLGIEIDGLYIEQVDYKDSIIYCEVEGCALSKDPKYSETKVTGISLLHISNSRAQHQGQFVCWASNKHGSNQASTIIDVEFREPPHIRIPVESKRQIIELDDDTGDKTYSTTNVTFKCTVEAGRPRPKLRWLRTGVKSSDQNKVKLVEFGGIKNMDIFDLTKVSSVTSNVTTSLEDEGRTLSLTISTVSLDDEGDYVCLAENEWGRHSAVANLVIRKPVSIRIAQQSPVIAKIDESLHLDCIASGHPSPLDIEWSRVDPEVSFFSMIYSSSSSLNGCQERAILKFDRVSVEDSGEYTCNARDPLNSSVILRDTIMVVVDTNSRASKPSVAHKTHSSQLPQVIVRPTKISVSEGSNVTLDCVAVSGLQPTVVEWVAPVINGSPSSIGDEQTTSVPSQPIIRPYYRLNSELTNGSHMLQFGSKLRIINVKHEHEGIYQCKGRNKLGVENAPALIKVIDHPRVDETEKTIDAKTIINSSMELQTKSKIATVGANIELKCQVNGIEQPATSWSREGQELPASSVQIEHNLWIRNVTENDNGLYLCSARSKNPNGVIQAKINLLVRQNPSFLSRSTNLEARIVASKSSVNVGDSLTLECMINEKVNSSQSIFRIGDQAIDLDEFERSVVWTNLHSGQTVFQDNVYILNNMLIIYDLRPENSAVYRCNYNEFSQHVDFRLRVGKLTSNWSNSVLSSSESMADHRQLSAHNRTRTELKSVPSGSNVKIECPIATEGDHYHWSRSRSKQRIGKPNDHLEFDSVTSKDADLYSCNLELRNISLESVRAVTWNVVLHVQQPPVVGFAQNPTSYISLPTISGADYQLDLELKILPEKTNGLILFNGQQQQPSTNRSNVGPTGDFISLGLSRGYLEFKFELGDGVTLLQSLYALELNQWHRVIIERNKRGAIMWVDDHPAVSNTSSGKFFNLNLDSVLYVGGHQTLLASGKRSRKFYGYSRGFQGCISLLRIGNNDIPLVSRNRSVSVGIFECDKSECIQQNCNEPNGICQVDVESAKESRKFMMLTAAQRQKVDPDLRCICLPGIAGDHCDSTDVISTTVNNSLDTTTITEPTESTKSSCELQKHNSCSSNGTLICDPLSSTSFKCHCKLGFTGPNCDEIVNFEGQETRAKFNEQGYLQFRFRRPEEVSELLGEKNLTFSSPVDGEFNLTNFAKLTSFVEQQNISFKLRTKSDYGILLYAGQKFKVSMDRRNDFKDSVFRTPLVAGNQQQSSKSMVANLLAKLAALTRSSWSDYLAIALIDGHLELSYELGSGVAIIRSTKRVNDGEWHDISVKRNGRSASLIIDQSDRYEGNSSGKLSMLNGSGDIYLGGLPIGDWHLQQQFSIFARFEGCISGLEINGLNPVNLVQSSLESLIISGRNMESCRESGVLTFISKVYRPTTSSPSSDGSDSDDGEDT